MCFVAIYVLPRHAVAMRFHRSVEKIPDNPLAGPTLPRPPRNDILPKRWRRELVQTVRRTGSVAKIKIKTLMRTNRVLLEIKVQKKWEKNLYTWMVNCLVCKTSAHLSASV